MPVKRRVQKLKPHRITPAAIEAFKAGDYLGLHRALGLKPWEPSPLPPTEPLGVDPKQRPSGTSARAEGWAKAVELQRELKAAARQDRRH